METTIKVLIVDDHKLISEAWTSLLKDAPNIWVVGTADNAEDAFSMTHAHKPDIVLMDINLGTGSGFDTPVALSFQPYDEIRFEGNETIVATIISSSFDQIYGLFNIYLQQPIDTTAVNVNYFAIRRWVPSINNLIINSPSNVMGAGLILPKYPSPLLDKNLPSIIENLTNKGLI